MAFRFGDPGGRIYGAVGTSNVNLLAWWSSVANSGAGTIAVSASNGRLSGNSSLRFGFSAGNNYYATVKALDAQSTWGAAFAFRTNILPTASTGALCQFNDSGTAQIDLRLNSTGTLSVTRAGTILGTSTAVLSLNTYYHIEIKILISDTVGTAEVRLNGVAVIGPLTGQDTKNTANATANQFALSGALNQANTMSWDFDDVIVWDGQVTDAAGNPDIHDFIGDCGLVWLPPTADGTTTQFTPSGGGNNYSNVDDTTPDGDTTYVEDDTIGHIDTYTLANLPSGAASVKSMAVVSYTRKTDFSSRGMKHELYTNSTNVAHTNEIHLADSYAYYMSTWGSNPTGTPTNWTVSDINNLEIGRQVTS